MQKFVCAGAILMAALACASASADYAAPILPYAAPVVNYDSYSPPQVYLPPTPRVAYVEQQLKSRPIYGKNVGYGAYDAPTYAQAPLLYRTIPLKSYGLVPGGPKTPLVAAPSNPRAGAAAATAHVPLRPGSYRNLAVPSYSIISGVPGPWIAPAPSVKYGRTNYGALPSPIY